MSLADNCLDFGVISFLAVLRVESGEVGVDIFRCD